MVEELLSWDFRVVLQGYVAWTICVAAILFGGGPERAVALVWLTFFEIIPWGFDLFYDRTHFVDSVDLLFAFVDAIAAGMWIGIALYANRNYTLWIAGMQVLAVCAHVASGIAEPITSIAYNVMAVAPSWIQLFLLAFGLVRHLLRKRSHGAYRDWRRGTWFSRFDRELEQNQMQSALAGGAGLDWREKVK